jgi:hypothetical protein
VALCFAALAKPPIRFADVEQGQRPGGGKYRGASSAVSTHQGVTDVTAAVQREEGASDLRVGSSVAFPAGMSGGDGLVEERGRRPDVPAGGSIPDHLPHEQR